MNVFIGILAFFALATIVVFVMHKKNVDA